MRRVMRAVLVGALLAAVAAGCSTGDDKGSDRATFGASDDGATSPSAPSGKAGGSASTQSLADLAIEPPPTIPMSGCTGIDPGTWDVRPATKDLGAAVASGDIPRFDGKPGTEGKPDDLQVFRTADDFLDQSNVADKPGRRAVMEHEGFHGGVEARFDDPVVHEVQVLRFRDTAGAVRYVRAHLPALCETLTEVHPLRGGGVGYVDGNGVPGALFILGDAEVRLNLCGCGDDLPLGNVLTWQILVNGILGGIPTPTR